MSCSRCWPEQGSREPLEDVFDFYVTGYTDQTGPEEGWVTCKQCRAQYGWSAFDYEYALVPTGLPEMPEARFRDHSLVTLFEEARSSKRAWVRCLEDFVVEKRPEAKSLEVTNADLPRASWEPWPTEQR
jgi:hypothetical protein